MPETAYIALGSNLGDRWANLRRARQALEDAGLRVVAASAVYETEPVGGPPQGAYLNAVVRVVTELGAEDLLGRLLSIERGMGRVRSVPNAPRVIDLDILFYGDAVVSGERLLLPHPRLHERRFVLQPLADVAAGVRHPVLGLTVSELLARCPDRSSVAPADGPGLGG